MPVVIFCCNYCRCSLGSVFEASEYACSLFRRRASHSCDFKMLDHDSESSSEEDSKPPMTPLEFAELMDVEYGVDEYFEPKELEEMSSIELRRYKNLRANYEVMKAMGE